MTDDEPSPIDDFRDRQFSKELLLTIRKAPKAPGVYLMKNESGEVIYVGKAKDLRARVRTYFSGGDGRLQIEFLLKKIAQLDTIVTQSENQAFVLERDLITKYKPRYNIRLKDDKTYLSIRLDENAPWPRLELVRRREHDGARYFGPYSFSYELKQLLEIIKRAVPLRTCTNTIFYNRQRPCLEYQIKRCAGPCCLPVDPKQYREWIRQAIAILEGRTQSLVKELTEKMEMASGELRFEEAAELRDRIETLTKTREGQALISSHGENRDVFAFHRDEALVSLTVLMVRNGRIAETENFSLQDVVVPDAELMEEAIEQYYQPGRDIPEEVVVSVDPSNREFIEQMLREKRPKGAGFELVNPQRGIRYRLVNLAQLNAKQRFLSTFDAEARGLELCRELAKALGLSQVPRRIECVDISNFQGSDIVGAVVVFFDGLPEKKSYTKYKLSFQDKPDDFKAIYEVVSRRLKNAIEQGTFPDLMIIDGGPQQLANACQARDELKLSLEIVSLAKMRSVEEGTGANTRYGDDTPRKKPERVFFEGKELPLELPPHSPVTHFLQRMRDEVHRFVIGFHRQRRGKRVMRSVLDDILGVGPDRRRRLLKEFGSIERMKNASVEEICKAGRMPKPLAEKILRKLSQNSESSQGE